MALALKRWVRDNAAVYIGNATTVRDFRSQLRGNKPILLWGAYLGILILVVALAYSGFSTSSDSSIAAVQSQLNTFYMVAIGMIGGIITVLTPSLTATTVIMEKQRKSLDLVFSAPVSRKYYLVGKMVSSLRYTWMLLALSLPVTAVCVVMGGATWVDVLGSYAILTGSALVFTSIGLLMSVLAPSVVSAVIWTYAVIGIYSLFIGTYASAVSFRPMMSGATGLENSWVVAMSPYTAALGAPTYSVILGEHVPNWLIGLFASLLVCKLLVLGAASAMSHFGSTETKGFRTHLLLLLAVLGYIVATEASSVSVMAGSGISLSSNVLATVAGWIVVAVALFTPNFSCWSHDADRRNRPDGWFRIRRTFLGTPSGALPFALATVIAFFAGIALAWNLRGGDLEDAALLATFAWCCIYVTFWWAVARLASALANNLKTARLLAVLGILALLALPIPILAMMSMPGYSSGTDTLFTVHMLYPLMHSSEPLQTLVYGGGMAAAAIVIALASHFATSRPPRVRSPKKT